MCVGRRARRVAAVEPHRVNSSTRCARAARGDGARPNRAEGALPAQNERRRVGSERRRRPHRRPRVGAVHRAFIQRRRTRLPTRRQALRDRRSRLFRPRRRRVPLRHSVIIDRSNSSHHVRPRTTARLDPIATPSPSFSRPLALSLFSQSHESILTIRLHFQTKYLFVTFPPKHKTRWFVRRVVIGEISPPRRSPAPRRMAGCARIPTRQSRRRRSARSNRRDRGRGIRSETSESLARESFAARPSRRPRDGRSIRPVGG